MTQDSALDAERGTNAAGPIQAFVHERFVEMFLDQNRRAQLGLVAAAALVAFVWHSRTRSLASLAWFVGLLLIAFVRFRFTDALVRVPDPRTSTQRIALVLAVNGVAMAVPLAAFGELSEVERAAVSIIQMASATASVATTSGYRNIFLAFAAPMLLPLGIAWSLTPHEAQPGTAAVGLGFLIWLFLFFLVGVARQGYRVFEESCRIRYAEQQHNEELTAALEQASAASRAKAQFLAAASHDLRQPLHSMNLLIDTLATQELKGRSGEVVSVLRGVNKSLSIQLAGLLDISRLDAGAWETQLSPYRIDILVSDHHRGMLPVAAARGLTCLLAIDARPVACTDSALLTRVLSNLTDNAMKFTPRGGEIVIRLHQEGGDAVLSVSDTGVGIPRHEHERVFEEFCQLGSSRDRMQGLGLGLSLVRRFCKLLDIGLRLTSEPGMGTTMTLRLACVSAMPHAQDEPAQPAPSLVGVSVLVIDDEAQVRDSMRLSLTEMGCIVQTAVSTEEARRLALAHPVDVVVADFRLHGGDGGMRALAAVRAIHPAARAVLVTGDMAPERITEARRAGVPLLHKPVPRSELVDALYGDAEPQRPIEGAMS